MATPRPPGDGRRRSRPRFGDTSVTAADMQTLNFIALHVGNGRPCPTHREMCAAFGMASTNAAACRFARLVRHGFLEGHDRRRHGAVVTDAGWRQLGLQPPQLRPLAGAVR